MGERIQKLHLKWPKPSLNSQNQEKYDKGRKICTQNKVFAKNMARAPEDSEGEEMTEWARVTDRGKGAECFQEGKHGKRLAAKHRNWTSRMIGVEIYHHTADHARKGKLFQRKKDQ